MPATKPAVPKPFKLSFDFYDDGHCEWRLESFRDELTDADRAVLDPDIDKLDMDATVRALADALERCEDDEELHDHLDDLRDGLKVCADYRCDCSQTSWECDEECFDEQLNELDEAFDRANWAIQDGRGDSDMFREKLTMRELFNSTRDRDGWASTSIEWDGTTLKVTFSGDRGGASALNLRALTPVQQRAYDEIESTYSGSGEDAWQLAGMDDARITDALEIWEQLAEDHYDVLDAAEVIYTLAQTEPLSDDERAILFGLVEGWEGSSSELVESARLLSHPVAA